MGPDLPREAIHGEWIGLIKTSAPAQRRSKRRWRNFPSGPISARCASTILFNHLIAQRERVQVLYITGHWLDVDDLDDLARAQAF